MAKQLQTLFELLQSEFEKHLIEKANLPEKDAANMLSVTRVFSEFADFYLASNPPKSTTGGVDGDVIIVLTDDNSVALRKLSARTGGSEYENIDYTTGVMPISGRNSGRPTGVDLKNKSAVNFNPPGGKARVDDRTK